MTNDFRQIKYASEGAMTGVGCFSYIGLPFNFSSRS